VTELFLALALPPPPPRLPEFAKIKVVMAVTVLISSNVSLSESTIKLILCEVIVLMLSLPVLTLAYTISAVLVTAFRLAARKVGKWWIDDLFAFVGVLAIILQTIVLWMRVKRVPCKPITFILTDPLTAVYQLTSSCGKLHSQHCLLLSEQYVFVH
jgi:hypothetical protein